MNCFESAVLKTFVVLMMMGKVRVHIGSIPLNTDFYWTVIVFCRCLQIMLICGLSVKILRPTGITILESEQEFNSKQKPELLYYNLRLGEDRMIGLILEQQRFILGIRAYSRSNQNMHAIFELF